MRDAASAPGEERRRILALIAPYEAPSVGRSLWQLASTLLAYAALETAMYASLGVSYWLTLALALPTAGMTVRLFIFQHDCGHRSFFRSQWANVAAGRLCSLLTYTPFTCWRRQHAQHHASFNNLDRRDRGLDIYSSCATVREYEALPASRRLLYRASRHPLLMLLVLPPVAFLLLYRVPFDTPAGWRQERQSVWWTNAGLVCLIGALVATLGARAVALVQLPVAVLGSAAGAWLFTVQHRFEASQWEPKEGWSQVQASLEGSSYLKLSAVLQWFTGNIGFHHIHHLSSRVPNYRLQECHEAAIPSGAVTTLTLRDALTAPCYALWDEQLRRMVRFPRRRWTWSVRRLPLGPLNGETRTVR
ncbi:MAG TPA: fatty acid desaturase [Frateuria sp.]|uniref:fatty acid desaturase family protein n=1 Tax=Frateuria sp. TaxID=2211372 RepID=UPI002D7F5671|nr:fatty acid desaturase [Frateuria sp.]HET6804198.1 fatty acid desaturase [Frateuria sp.]